MLQYMQHVLTLKRPNPARQRYYFRSITLVECYGSCNTLRDLAVEVKTAFLGRISPRETLTSSMLPATEEIVKAMTCRGVGCVNLQREKSASTPSKLY